MKKLIPALCALLAIILSACEHKELCYIHPHETKLFVEFDWRYAPDANPEGMLVYFYSMDNPGRYYRFDFPASKRREIEIPEGKYIIISYNNDTEAVRFSGHTGWDGHSAYTRDGDVLEPMYGNGITSSVRDPQSERVVITPDQLYGCSVTEVEVTDHGITYIHHHGGVLSPDFTKAENQDQVITLYPEDLLCHYSYEVRNVKQANHIKLICASLSGMAGGMNLFDQTLHTEPITLPVPGQPRTDIKQVTGEFLTFGHHDKNFDPHQMTFYVVMDDERKYIISGTDNLDVTSQVHSAPDRRRVHLIIDKLDLPEPIEGDGGFNPAVNDWGVIYEDINM